VPAGDPVRLEPELFVNGRPHQPVPEGTGR
jgi:hypothetical protein